jgi:RNA polymerase sigma factor (sigma-70 family)
MGTFAQDWRRCLRSPRDNSAWENFLGEQKRVLTGIVFRVARRFGVAGSDEIDDAVQDVCLKISVQVRAGKLSDDDDLVLENYTKALVANAAHDYFRGQRAKKRDILARIPLDSDLPQRVPEFRDLKMDDEILLSQIHELVGGDVRSQRVFQLYYRLGWTAKEIARIDCLGLSAKGVESLVYRLTSDLRQKMKPGGSNRSSGKKEIPPQST